jgi:oxygen-independent coproporphyrinogen-3 oxidase
MPDVGLYLHLPYCTSLCPYCDFNSYVDPKAPWEALTSALEREIATRAPVFATPWRSVYFGGGTPSLAPPDTVRRLIEAARQAAGLAADAELTLEVNPGTVTEASLAAFREVGINRVSLGWQSTHDRLLRVLGRGHSAADSHAAYAASRAAGFDNISLDLIFAVPGQSMADLDADLDRVLALAPEHVSLYALTYKPGTPFERRRLRGTLTPADEDLEADMMDHIEARLSAVGFEHYEVSNYALPGRRAVHNSLYWRGGRYLGVGPGAHSFHHEAWATGWRWEAVRDPAAYIAAWQTPPPPGVPATGDGTVTWCEALTPRQLFSERMLCGLRQADGVSLQEPALAAHADTVAAGVAEATARGWGRVQGDRLIPTPAGLTHADALAALFF